MDFPTSPTNNQVFVVGNRSWRWNGGAWEKLGTVNSATASVTGWTKVVDKSGSSMTGLTAQSGTWTTDGTVITNSAAGLLTLDEFNVRFPFYLQAELKVVTAGGSNKNNGFMGPYPGTSSMAGYNRIQIQWSGNDTVSITTDGSTERTSKSFAPALDTWYKLGALFTDTTQMSVFINDTSYIINQYAPVSQFECKRVALMGNASDAKWRNIAVWVPSHLSTMPPTFLSSLTFETDTSAEALALMIAME
jgi:hypothetical protein